MCIPHKWRYKIELFRRIDSLVVWHYGINYAVSSTHAKQAKDEEETGVLNYRLTTHISNNNLLQGAV